MNADENPLMRTYDACQAEKQALKLTALSPLNEEGKCADHNRSIVIMTPNCHR